MITTVAEVRNAFREEGRSVTINFVTSKLEFLGKIREEKKYG